MHNQPQRKQRRDLNDHAIGQDFGHGNFACAHRHDQQMLDRSVLSLSDNRRAHQNDRENGDVGNDLHHRRVPMGVGVGIEQEPRLHLYRRLGFDASAVKKIQGLRQENFLEIICAEARLRHCRGVDQHLHGRLPPGQHIGFKPWREFYDENVASSIERVLNISTFNVFWWFEVGRMEPARNRRADKTRRSRNRGLHGASLRVCQKPSASAHGLELGEAVVYTRINSWRESSRAGEAKIACGAIPEIRPFHETLVRNPGRHSSERRVGFPPFFRLIGGPSPPRKFHLSRAGNRGKGWAIEL